MAEENKKEELNIDAMSKDDLFKLAEEKGVELSKKEKKDVGLLKAKLTVVLAEENATTNETLEEDGDADVSEEEEKIDPVNEEPGSGKGTTKKTDDKSLFGSTVHTAFGNFKFDKSGSVSGSRQELAELGKFVKLV